MSGPTLYSLDEAGLLQLRHVALYLAGTETQSVRQGFLPGIGFPVAVPPMVTELHEHRELRRIEAESLLCPQQQRRYNTTQKPIAMTFWPHFFSDSRVFARVVWSWIGRIGTTLVICDSLFIMSDLQYPGGGPLLARVQDRSSMTSLPGHFRLLPGVWIDR